MAASPKVQEPSMEEILASIRRIMADDEQPAAHAEAAPRRGENPPSGDGRPRRPPEPRVVAQRQAPPEPPPIPRRPAPRDATPVAGAYAAAPRPASRPAAPVRPAGERPVAEAPARQQRPWLDEQDEAVFAEAAAALRQARHEPPPASQRAEPRPVQQPTYPDHPVEEMEDRHEPAAAQPQPRPLRPQPASSAFEDHRPAQPAGDGHPAESVRRRDLLSANADAAVMAAFRNLGDVLLPQKERTVEDLVKEILRPMLKDWLDANLPTIVEDLVRAEIERVARRQR